MHASDPKLYWKIDSLALVFSCEFDEILKEQLFYRIPPSDCFWKMSRQRSRLMILVSKLLDWLPSTFEPYQILFDLKHTEDLYISSTNDISNAFSDSRVSLVLLFPIYKWNQKVCFPQIFKKSSFKINISFNKFFIKIHL